MLSPGIIGASATGVAGTVFASLHPFAGVKRAERPAPRDSVATHDTSSAYGVRLSIGLAIAAIAGHEAAIRRLSLSRTNVENVAVEPDSCISSMTHTMLWQITLSNSSLHCATGLLLRKISPNLPLHRAVPRRRLTVALGVAGERDERRDAKQGTDAPGRCNRSARERCSAFRCPVCGWRWIARE